MNQIGAQLNGGQDNLNQIQLIRLYRERSPPFQQALHFGFAGGSAVSPAIVALFIEDDPKSTRYKLAYYVIGAYLGIVAIYTAFLTQNNFGPFSDYNTLVIPRHLRLQSQAEQTVAKVETDLELLCDDTIKQTDKQREDLQNVVKQYTNTTPETIYMKSQNIDVNPAVVTSTAIGNQYVTSSILDNAKNSSILPTIANVRIVSSYDDEERDNETSISVQHSSKNDDCTVIHLHAHTKDDKINNNEDNKIELDTSNNNEPKDKDIDLDIEQHHKDTTKEKMYRFYGNRTFLLLITSQMLAFYIGVETGFGVYLPSYVVNANQQDDAGGAALSFAYWGSIAIGRGLGIYITLFFSDTTIIASDLVVSCISFIILTIFTTSKIITWIFTCIFGIGVASQYAGVMSWQNSTTHMDGKTVTIITALVSAGEAGFPYLFSVQLQSSYGPKGMMTMATLIIVGCSLTYIFIFYYIKKYSYSEDEMKEL